jgi:hypothetical protein
MKLNFKTVMLSAGIAAILTGCAIASDRRPVAVTPESPIIDTGYLAALPAQVHQDIHVNTNNKPPSAKILRHRANGEVYVADADSDTDAEAEAAQPGQEGEGGSR